MQARQVDAAAMAAAALGVHVSSTTPVAARLAQALVLRAFRAWPGDVGALRELAESLADAAVIVGACVELLDDGAFDEADVVAALGRVTP